MFADLYSFKMDRWTIESLTSSLNKWLFYLNTLLPILDVSTQIQSFSKLTTGLTIDHIILKFVYSLSLTFLASRCFNRGEKWFPTSEKIVGILLPYINIQYNLSEQETKNNFYFATRIITWWPLPGGIEHTNEENLWIYSANEEKVDKWFYCEKEWSMGNTPHPLTV